MTNWTADNWPIGGNMLSFGNKTPDGTPLEQASSTLWASQVRQMKELGIDLIDPTDAWLSLARLSDARLEEFRRVLDGEGVELLGISMTRNSVIDAEHGLDNLETAKRYIDIAPGFGISIVNTGFMQALTPAQANAVWFWLEDGHHDDPALRDLAMERIRQLGDLAAGNGVQISLEMYEDTFVGTPDEAVSFVTDVGHKAVGLNPDIGNLIRLHRELEPWPDMFEKVLPHSNYWHIKNYSRDYDPQSNSYATAPMPLKYGYVNYRQVIRRALELGYRAPFCCEHYGSDSIGVISENVAYIRQILTSTLAGQQ